MAENVITAILIYFQSLSTIKDLMLKSFMAKQEISPPIRHLEIDPSFFEEDDESTYVIINMDKDEEYRKFQLEASEKILREDEKRSIAAKRIRRYI